MTFMEVMEAVKAMGTNFNYIDYLRLVFSNFWTGAMYCTSILSVVGIIAAYGVMIRAIVKAWIDHLVDEYV